MTHYPLAIALIFSAFSAWDFGRRWIEEQGKRRVADSRVAELEQKSSLHDEVIEKLAIDWRQKFRELEGELKAELERRDRAQPVPQPRGFNRG